MQFRKYREKEKFRPLCLRIYFLPPMIETKIEADRSGIFQKDLSLVDEKLNKKTLSLSMIDIMNLEESVLPGLGAEAIAAST